MGANRPANQKPRGLWLPIIFFQIYLNISVFLFAFGPWPWPISNPVELYSFLTASHILLALGYYSGHKKALRSRLVTSKSKIDWLRISLILNLVMLLPSSFSRTGIFLPNIMFGLAAPGEAYQNAVERSFSGGPWVIIEYIRIILAPLLALSFPFVVATWQKRTTNEKLCCAFIILFNISMYISMGTNKTIVDTVLLVPWLMALAIASRHLILNKKQKTILALASLTAMFGAFIFFGYGQTQRSGGVASGRTFGPPIFIEPDPANWMTYAMPEQYQIYVESLLRYLCQGYYALSRAMLLDFESTFGVGNSIFLSRAATSLTGMVELGTHTYPARLEAAEGWGELTLWHSIYTWIASDVGFAGTLLIVFFIGRYLAMSWIYAILYTDKLSILLFTYLTIMLLYFPANNQLMQNGESCMGFLLTLFLWLLFTGPLMKEIKKIRKMQILKRQKKIPRLPKI